jgi:predicted dehydrogenase
MAIAGSTLRLGIVGMGGMGTSHLKNALALPRVTVTAVCDTDRARAAAAAAAVPGARAFTSAGELVSSGCVDAVLVATPHFQHLAAAEAAFAHGLHVLTEKPLCVFAEDARLMVGAYEQARARFPGLQFAAMFQQRTLPAWRKVKELLEAGALGRVIRGTWIVTDWYRPQAYFSNGWRGTWKGDGGGVLMNQSPHQLDLFWWFLGLPRRVYGHAGFGKYHAIEVEDEVSAYFEYAEGHIGHFITSTAEYPGTNRLEISGERGRLVVDNGVLHLQRNDMSTAEHIRTAAGPLSKPTSVEVAVPVVATEGSPHAAVLANFVEAVLDGAPLIAPAAEGVHSVMMANGVIFSALAGVPVDLPLEEGALAAAVAARMAGAGNRPGG